MAPTFRRQEPSEPVLGFRRLIETDLSSATVLKRYRLIPALKTDASTCPLSVLDGVAAPTAVMVHQVLGAIAQFEKTSRVAEFRPACA